MRHIGGVNIVAYRPQNILQVTQTNHWRLTVKAASPRIEMVRLKAA